MISLPHLLFCFKNEEPLSDVLALLTAPSCVPVQAACYGRAFCSAEAFPRDRIVTVCRQLRILNALRAHGIGLPLTAAQVRFMQAIK